MVYVMQSHAMLCHCKNTLQTMDFLLGSNTHIICFSSIVFFQKCCSKKSDCFEQLIVLKLKLHDFLKIFL